MAKNRSHIKPILFKDILKKETPTKHILFSKLLQSENLAPNLGAVSSSFNPIEDSEIKLHATEQASEDASMDLDQKIYDRMEEEGYFDNETTHKPKVKSTNDRFRW